LSFQTITVTDTTNSAIFGSITVDVLAQAGGGGGGGGGGGSGGPGRLAQGTSLPLLGALPLLGPAPKSWAVSLATGHSDRGRVYPEGRHDGRPATCWPGPPSCSADSRRRCSASSSALG